MGAWSPSPALLGLLAAVGLLSLTVASLPDPPPLVTPAELGRQAEESIVDLRGICLGGRTLTSGRQLLLLGDPIEPLSVPVFLPADGDALAALDVGAELVVRGRRIALDDGPGLRADWVGVRVASDSTPEVTLRVVLTFPELYRGERLELEGVWEGPAAEAPEASEAEASLSAGRYTLTLLVPIELLDRAAPEPGALVRVAGDFAYEPEQGRWALRVISLVAERSG